MTQQLARVEPATNYMTAWSQEDLNLIKKTVAKNADDAEFKLFLYTAWKYELDPLVKQIWCVKYGNNPAAIYAGRDGFLAIAHRSGQLDGMETTAIRDDTGKLIAARCEVWRKDMKHPFSVEVALSEYKSNTNANWNTRPETMLKKVAESQCLRRAFSISGMYEPSEMDGNEEQQPALPVAKAQPTSRIVSIVPNTATVPEPEPDEPAGPEPMTFDEFGTWFFRITGHVLDKERGASYAKVYSSGQETINDWKKALWKAGDRDELRTILKAITLGTRASEGGKFDWNEATGLPVALDQGEPDEITPNDLDF